jgi:hypothetical protein
VRWAWPQGCQHPGHWYEPSTKNLVRPQQSLASLL